MELAKFFTIVWINILFAWIAINAFNHRIIQSLK